MEIAADEREEGAAAAGRHRRGALTYRTITVAGRQRGFWLAPPAGPTAPLLIVLHGRGVNGRGMAAMSGLSVRGPAAGFTVALPDAADGVWDDGRDLPEMRGRGDVDDAAFLRQLATQLMKEGAAGSDPPWLVGMSNGAFMAERLARHCALEVAGLALVAGTAAAPSRRARERPLQAARLVGFWGTEDPVVPYEGGVVGPSPLPGDRGSEPRRGEAVAAEQVAADWAAANCLSRPPHEELVPATSLGVTRFRWEEAGKPGVVLHRIEGGGHTWPGGPQYLPVPVIGRVEPNLDATGIILEMARTSGRT